MSEQEKVYKSECYCCKKVKEVRPRCVSEAEARKIENEVKEINVNYRHVCKDCDHIGD